MARKTAPKVKKTKAKPKAKAKAKAGKRPVKRSARSVSGKATPSRAAPQSPPPPSLSREVIEEVLLHSASASEAEPLSDKALSEIALCANLDPSRVLEVHRRLCEAAADDAGVTVVRVVELWDPYEEE